MKTIRRRSRLLALLAAFSMVVAACATDDGATDDGAVSDTTDTTEAVTDTTVETTTETTEPAAEDDEEPADEEPTPSAAEERGLYLVSEFLEEFPEHAELQEQVLATTQAEAVPTTADVDSPVQIVMFIPSLEVSDAWARLEGALEGRLNDLEIPHEITHFLTTPDGHAEQAGQVETALADPEQFDFAIFAPTEWEGQKETVARLSEQITTLAYNVANPFYDLWGTDRSPITHIAFDHETGARLLCDWAVEETGGEGRVALLRGVPGFVDDLRSQTFGDCVEENSNMEVVTELFTDFDREQAFTAANTVLTSNPDVTFMHAASTGVALGALAAQRERGVVDDMLLNGWGGGSDELAELKAGGLDVVVFRVIDDWGASGAEIIKLYLEGRVDEIPGVVSPTMKMLDHRATDAEIDEETEFAFRYSGDIDR